VQAAARAEVVAVVCGHQRNGDNVAEQGAVLNIG
jgi:hypothetical protein